MNRCERNMTDEEHVPSWQRPAHQCGKTPVVVRWSDRECHMCPEHAAEAERAGCDVDWDEVAA